MIDHRNHHSSLIEIGLQHHGMMHTGSYGLSKCRMALWSNPKARSYPRIPILVTTLLSNLFVLLDTHLRTKATCMHWSGHRVSQVPTSKDHKVPLYRPQMPCHL